MQAFFYESEEGEAEGLKLIEGKVKKFNMNSPKYKAPHMDGIMLNLSKMVNSKVFLKRINFICTFFLCVAIMKKTF